MLWSVCVWAKTSWLSGISLNSLSQTDRETDRETGVWSSMLIITSEMCVKCTEVWRLVPQTLFMRWWSPPLHPAAGHTDKLSFHLVTVCFHNNDITLKLVMYSWNTHWGEWSLFLSDQNERTSRQNTFNEENWEETRESSPGGDGGKGLQSTDLMFKCSCTKSWNICSNVWWSHTNSSVCDGENRTWCLWCWREGQRSWHHQTEAYSSLTLTHTHTHRVTETFCHL